MGRIGREKIRLSSRNLFMRSSLNAIQAQQDSTLSGQFGSTSQGLASLPVTLMQLKQSLAEYQATILQQLRVPWMTYPCHLLSACNKALKIIYES